MSKRPYDEVSVLRVLSKNRAINIVGRNIEVDSTQESVGNGTWGKLDYLRKVHGYSYVILKATDKKQKKNYAPRVINPNKADQPSTTPKAHPAKLNMAGLSKKAMKTNI